MDIKRKYLLILTETGNQGQEKSSGLPKVTRQDWMVIPDPEESKSYSPGGGAHAMLGHYAALVKLDKRQFFLCLVCPPERPLPPIAAIWKLIRPLHLILNGFLCTYMQHLKIIIMALIHSALDRSFSCGYTMMFFYEKIRLFNANDLMILNCMHPFLFIIRLCMKEPGYSIVFIYFIY